MQIDDRVKNKSGSIGTIKEITREWVYVHMDGTRTAFPCKAGWLTVIEGEGDHDQGNI